jgi:hypothetical protein
MKLTYSGPREAVLVPDAGLTVERDTPTEVPDALAEQLLKRPGWKRLTTRKER